MKKILAFNGGMRAKGNTRSLMLEFFRGASEAGATIEEIKVTDLNLNYCNGCLRCNMIGYCGQRGDQWEEVSAKIKEADVVVFASPIYFHHVTAAMKKLIDRFRSFVHVQITETGLEHSPREVWNKDFVLIMSMGSSDDSDSQPVISLFNFINGIMNPDMQLNVIKGTRLAVIGQLEKSEKELEELYTKMNIPTSLASVDYKRNRELMNEAFMLGQKLG